MAIQSGIVAARVRFDAPMAARKSSASRVRQDNSSSPRPPAADVPEHVREFQRGLFPILVAGDVEAFGHYLSRWEEVIGDTAELGQLPPAEQRRLMARLLRRPQLYNLPAWPADLADTAGLPAGADVAGDRRSVDLPSGVYPATEWPAANRAPAPASGVYPAANRSVYTSAPASVAVARGLVPRNDAALAEDATLAQSPPVPAASSPPVATPPALEDEPASPHASYQLDMITGELVPVAVEPARVTEAAAGYEAEPGRPAKPRARRRRRQPANLVQLALWSEEPPGG
jgi:hypothetical protein